MAVKLKKAKKLLPVDTTEVVTVMPDKITDPVVEVEVPKVNGPLPTTVMVTLPLKSQSKAYLEFEIAGKQSWVAKESVTELTISEGMATMLVPRTYARRKGLLNVA